MATLFGWEEEDGASMLFGEVALCAVYEIGDTARLRAPAAIPFTAPHAHDDLHETCPDVAPPADILADLGEGRAVPVLVLSGTHDPITPPAFGAATAALFDDARHVIVEGAGHGVTWTARPEAAEALTAFVRGVAAAQTADAGSQSPSDSAAAR